MGMTKKIRFYVSRRDLVALVSPPETGYVSDICGLNTNAKYPT